LRRGLALGVGVVVAAVSFVLLTSSAQSSSLRVHGTLKNAFRPAYDILVRPPNSQTPLETSERLVRPNFMSAIFGGISLSQWHHVEQIRGVAVAAPVANVGYLLVDTSSIVRVVVALEGLMLGLIGSGMGALVGLALGALPLDVPIGPLALASLAATAGGTIAAGLASLLPLSQLNRLTVPAVLAAE
jgi:hypothetical protein